jgi:hypothetical protein
MRGTPGMIATAIATAAALAGAYLWGTQALGRPLGLGPGITASPRDGANGEPMMIAQPPPPAAPLQAAPLLHPAAVTVATPGFWSWALLNRRTGQLNGSRNMNATNVTASMLKAWLASDFLRRSAEKRQTPPKATLSRLSVMIRDSDNAAASDFFAQLGGSASISRLVRLCGLTDSRANIDWANMLISARDSARMAVCIGDGRAAGPQWTPWVLGEMRNVRGVGRFGIITALPVEVAKVTAIKNGWVARSDGKWHVNCMAIGPDWTLAVMVVYPASKGFAHGGAVCQSVTRQLMA